MHRPPLPVASTPNWELKDDPDSLKSIAESCVTLQSLRQSREFWLSAFPKFSSRARGSKAQDVVPPPHTIQTRGKCDLEIGPILLPDTLFYEVHYLPPKHPQTQLPTLSLSTGYVTGTQPSTSTSASSTAANSSSATTAATQPSTPLLSSLSPLSSITPALINQVNTAASTNPILANLLQLAATGKATPDQLKTLGLLIQSLATVGPLQPTQVPIPSPAAIQPPVKPFDLVLEFQECPYDRFLFPRCQAVCERMVDNPLSTYQDVLVAAPVPFSTDSDTVSNSTTPQAAPSLQVATMRIKQAPAMLWETLSRWVGGEQNLARNREFLSRLQPDRVYLAQHLREGPLLTELKALAAPNFTMKPIDPSAPGGIKPKRKYTRREPKAKASVPKIPPPAFLVLSPQTPQTGASGSTHPPAVPVVTAPTVPTPVTSSVANTAPTHVPPPAKKQRVKQPKPPLPRIACFSCDMTDVPLIMGGRFCRPCVESGKANPDIPQPTRSTGSSHRAYYQSFASTNSGSTGVTSANTQPTPSANRPPSPSPCSKS